VQQDDSGAVYLRGTRAQAARFHQHALLAPQVAWVEEGASESDGHQPHETDFYLVSSQPPLWLWGVSSHCRKQQYLGEELLEIYQWQGVRFGMVYCPSWPAVAES
jgi:hypothetical protein